MVGELVLPFTFACNFAPANMEVAMHAYRESFVPSETLEKPYVIGAIRVFAADSQAEAERLATTSGAGVIMGKLE
ncbi:coenzyme F420-dependent N5,N10-methylene tetrahydromethanopterin reductase [Corynebacterium callunae DSM 20147]|uniref:Coenzyme F420-dependent N5,N10-methylene tetrahydromethanopterin reductase n=1 Tax=Corynebacterium callunae DSM 20147 TaxID=1121353 RepID=M1TTM9_9CORY|nr:coenzyme F420-dependent N5,N10-methylene tetrahydromethanopterin reductase [Corynebacterium callunae DSM 20147]